MLGLRGLARRITQDEIEARLGLGRKRLLWQIAFLAPCWIVLGVLAEVTWSDPPWILVLPVGWWFAGIGVAYLMTPGAGPVRFDGPDQAEFL